MKLLVMCKGTRKVEDNAVMVSCTVLDTSTSAVGLDGRYWVLSVSDRINSELPPAGPGPKQKVV